MPFSEQQIIEQSAEQPIANRLIVRQLGVQPYETVWQQMQQFTDNRDDRTLDEVWLVQHSAVFTQGQAGKAEHLLQQSAIPVVQSDRGGQITYHAPGQQVMYVLLDIKRKKTQSEATFSVRDLVSALENTVIQTLADYSLQAYARADAPGVYVEGRKICSLGLRIRRGCSFHGLALNINMDLTPFNDINPCGYAGLEMCQLSELIGDQTLLCEQVAPQLLQHFINLMDYQQIQYVEN
ncbi:lipoyl(octanoyl) transferase LipB [Testudinibacter sp. TR-2022]|uniref:lipoyl(octanoyl) transferase LipB n=1 Tax=Testudinibacter sp. TR-2022 TaxID=2585029 RepID=UPI001117E0F2|nr:lipoyl(octanoyl) transferase LipB [Testudinibacter sp. TR-2022]TNH04363.1 lipoyl(octanoyl) transferase LipB [Pasteurellaceae bacterium Phil31]TNH10907.1 lipoyl(octanoyl) transferase LipB [Testudinibacter sp. TR-2022]TNH11095.1 lipoyl(octanoyl) transferase LipB [Testudinibacter sp. TR-2022]TNH12358.1 lipoyl(octanoyl) transferase LipB [Testudinibacter sp. TR-2022]TNH19105.1 lipoyl(octanoyl) transferase LipB [Testudinibacter sp. TR-2022]